jgi:hypothetical protein
MAANDVRFEHDSFNRRGFGGKSVPADIAQKRPQSNSYLLASNGIRGGRRISPSNCRSDASASFSNLVKAHALPHVTFMYTKFTPISTRVRDLLSFQQKRDSGLPGPGIAHSHCGNLPFGIDLLHRSRNRGPSCEIVSGSVGQARE